MFLDLWAAQGNNWGPGAGVSLGGHAVAQLLAGGLGRDWWSWEVETKESAGWWMWVLREDRVQVSGEELPAPEMGG